MSIELSDRETELVRKARRYKKSRLWNGYTPPGLILIGLFMSQYLRIEMEIFVAMAFGASLFSALNMQFRLYPTYKGLLSLIEQNVPESRDAIQVVSDAVQSLNNAKSGT